MIYTEILAKSGFIPLSLPLHVRNCHHILVRFRCERKAVITFFISSVLRINETLQPALHKQRDCILGFMLSMSPWEYNVSLVITVVYNLLLVVRRISFRRIKSVFICFNLLTRVSGFLSGIYTHVVVCMNLLYSSFHIYVRPLKHLEEFCINFQRAKSKWTLMTLGE